VKLGGADPGLLRRALGFSDDLNAHIITTIRPRLMLVPFSFGREPRLDKVYRVGVALAQASDCRERTVTTDQRPFRLVVATYRRGTLALPVVYLPHPASLRIRTETARRLVETVPKLLVEFH
jgi:hypothetical protein